MGNGDGDGTVVQYIVACMQAAGVTLEDATATVGDESDWLVRVLERDQPLPLERVAEATRAVCADPMELFSRCIAEYLPNTFAAIEPRLEAALTADELVLVKHLRAWVGSSYLAGLADDQRSKLMEWLRSMRETLASTTSVH